VLYGHLLVISEDPDDIKFAKYLAATNTLPFDVTTDPKKIKDILIEFPATIVLWNIRGEALFKKTQEPLTYFGSPARIFAIAAQAVSKYPHLANCRSYGHLLRNRYEKPAPLVCSKLIQASLVTQRFGLLRFFPGLTKSQKISITKSTQKGPAVEAVQSFLVKKGITPRLCAQAAKAVDELVMNAIFDAPVLDGAYFRRAIPRNAEFDLEKNEIVEIEVAEAQQYVGISVSDTYGSLKKSVLQGFLALDYQDQKYVVKKSDPSAGLGVHGIAQSGISLLFVSQPGKRTEAMIFFPRAKTFREFRESFHFVSILSE